MPKLYIIAGPNGAGKTTASSEILSEMKCKEFVNADSIASGLSAFNYDEVAFQAGRIMLGRIKALAAKQIDFAFETTLSSRSFLPFIRDCRKIGYETILFYFYIHSVEVSIKRVAGRVEKGGHDIPRETIRRRFPRSLHNLINLYLPSVDKWIIFDNTFEVPSIIAENKRIFDKDNWSKILAYKE